MRACTPFRCLVAVIITAAAAALSGLNAQEVAGSVQGRIVGTSAQPQPEVQVAISGPNLQGIRTAITDRDGFFHVPALPPGGYAVRITKIGFRPVVVEQVEVQIGRVALIGPVTLEPQPVELEPLVVTAARATIDPVHTTVGATLDAADYAALPADRDYKSLIAILPHVNTSYYGDPVNVAGSTGLENMYFIDGVNVTSTLDGSTGTSLPYNFVRAVEVKAGGYEAQYGKALGAVVNAVTYTGTNTHEASVFAFTTPSDLTASAKTPSDLRESNSISYDIGLRIGGPVVRDRFWYSAAYNPHIDRVEKEITGLGLFADRRTAQLFAGKLTWQATPAANVELSLLGDPTVHHQVAPIAWIPSGLTVINPDPYLGRLTSGGVTGSLRSTATVGARVLLEGSIAYATSHQSTDAETPIGRTEPLYVDYVSGAVAGGLFQLREISMGRTAAALRSTVSLGRHTEIIGIEYEDAALSQTVITPGGSNVSRTADSQFTAVAQSTTGEFHNRVPTVYVQDSWRVTDRLALNAGLRWSAQFLTAASGGTAQRFPGEWQPRLGFIWQLGRPGKQRVFGSYGRFYQQELLNLSSAWYADFYYTSSNFSVDPRQPGSVPESVYDGTTYEADWAKSIDGLRVEHLDELTLGYEHVLGSAASITIQGIQRKLRSSFQWGIAGVDSAKKIIWVLGTPGKGSFAYLPPPKREYTSLELGLQGGSRRLHYRASYVLSRAWGNYPGLYDTDAGAANPGASSSLFSPAQARNSSGLLPNDRTHVFKLAAALRPGSRLETGAFFTWQTGTPLNEFGAAPFGGYTFLAPRGSVGRTPSIWELNLRFAYTAPWPSAGSRLVLDILHAGNPRRVVREDQIHFSSVDSTGNPIDKNPNYLHPVGFQPPMTIRLGLEISLPLAGFEKRAAQPQLGHPWHGQNVSSTPRRTTRGGP